jgi:hypothetical protein
MATVWPFWGIGPLPSFVIVFVTPMIAAAVVKLRNAGAKIDLVTILERPNMCYCKKALVPADDSGMKHGGGAG